MKMDWFIIWLFANHQKHAALVGGFHRVPVFGTLDFKLGYHKRQLVDHVANAFSFKPEFGARRLDVRCNLQCIHIGNKN